MEKMEFIAFTAIGGQSLEKQDKFSIHLPKQEVLKKNLTFFTYKKTIYDIQSIYYNVDKEMYYLKVGKTKKSDWDSLIHDQIFSE